MYFSSQTLCWILTRESLKIRTMSYRFYLFLLLYYFFFSFYFPFIIIISPFFLSFFLATFLPSFFLSFVPSVCFFSFVPSLFLWLSLLLSCPLSFFFHFDFIFSCHSFLPFKIFCRPLSFFC